MPIYEFADTKDGVYFEYSPKAETHDITIKLKGESAYKLNLEALKLYGLYKETIFRSYEANPGLAEDIKRFGKVYQEPPKSPLAKSPIYQSPVNHYAILACTDAMKEWLKQDEAIKSYKAFVNINNRKKLLGFVHFVDRVVDGRPVIYIAHAGVALSMKGRSIGRRLMECVLSHYPANTEFYILTRIFNDDAIRLYHNRLGFEEIKLDEIKQLGYDERYCGFKRISSKLEIDDICVRRKSCDIEQPEGLEEKKPSAFQR